MFSPSLQQQSFALACGEKVKTWADGLCFVKPSAVQLSCHPHQQKRNFGLPKGPFLLSKPQAWYGINAPRALYDIAMKSRMALREARIE